MPWKLPWDDGYGFPSFSFLDDFDDVSEAYNKFEHSPLVYLEPVN